MSVSLWSSSSLDLSHRFLYIRTGGHLHAKLMTYNSHILQCFRTLSFLVYEMEMDQGVVAVYVLGVQVLKSRCWMIEETFSNRFI